MAQLTITIANADVGRALAALGYQDTINGQPNPESKITFGQRKIKEWIKQRVREYEVNQAAVAARVTAAANADNIDIT